MTDRDLLHHVLWIHPPPFRVERDWTWEVYDAKGVLVAKCMTQQEAYALVDIRNEMRSPRIVHE